jgi:hypothetical protein
MRARYATIAKAFDAFADREDQLGRAAASVLEPSDAAQTVKHATVFFLLLFAIGAGIILVLLLAHISL